MNKIHFRTFWTLVLFFGLASVASSQTPGLMESLTDRPGGDYRSFDLVSGPDVCRNTCAGESQCLAWTYVKPGVIGSAARCFLKSTVPDSVSKDCCTSGVKSLNTSNEDTSFQRLTDRQGGDYRSFDLLNNPRLCRDACAQESQCMAWTFAKPGVIGDSAKCFLKSTVPAATANSCCDSGVKQADTPQATPMPRVTSWRDNPLRYNTSPSEPITANMSGTSRWIILNRVGIDLFSDASKNGGATAINMNTAINEAEIVNEQKTVTQALEFAGDAKVAVGTINAIIIAGGTAATVASIGTLGAAAGVFATIGAVASPFIVAAHENATTIYVMNALKTDMEVTQVYFDSGQFLSKRVGSGVSATHVELKPIGNQIQGLYKSWPGVGTFVMEKKFGFEGNLGVIQLKAKSASAPLRTSSSILIGWANPFGGDNTCAVGLTDDNPVDIAAWFAREIEPYHAEDRGRLTDRAVSGNLDVSCGLDDRDVDYPTLYVSIRDNSDWRTHRPGVGVGSLPADATDHEMNCWDYIQGSIPWNSQGNTQWDLSSLILICDGTPDSKTTQARAKCVQDEAEIRQWNEYKEFCATVTAG